MSSFRGWITWLLLTFCCLDHFVGLEDLLSQRILFLLLAESPQKSDTSFAKKSVGPKVKPLPSSPHPVIDYEWPFITPLEGSEGSVSPQISLQEAGGIHKHCLATGLPPLPCPHPAHPCHRHCQLKHSLYLCPNSEFTSWETQAGTTVPRDFRRKQIRWGYRLLVGLQATVGRWNYDRQRGGRMLIVLFCDGIHASNRGRECIHLQMEGE